MTGVRVRPATERDLPAIVALYNALLPTTTIAYREELATLDEMTAWFAAQHSDGNPVLVADLGGAAVGYTTWGTFRGGTVKQGYRHSAELTIHVDGRHHGEGIGRLLMNGLVDEARRRDIHVLVAGIDSSNVESLAFHAKLGFVETARMPEVGVKFGKWLTLVLMQRIVD